MDISRQQVAGDYELVVRGQDEASGYHGIIAVHSTALGPAVGGTRLWAYASEAEALTDVLRLARGMTYKNALAGLPFGGGKSIIIGDNQTLDRAVVFRAHGRFIETLGGRYITAEDVGTSTADMDYVRQETSHVTGLADRSGDPSPATARGVFRAIQASAKQRWGSDDLAGRTIALQGCGHVGYHLAKELHRAGAKLIVADIDAERVRRVVDECAATAVAPADIYSAPADIFAPCGLGGIINDETLTQLKVEIVAGAANNQLLAPRHGAELEARGILYAPDYVANAGGMINGCIELIGWSRADAARKIDEIYDTLLTIFRVAAETGSPTYQAADRLAESRLHA
ncbi:MAG: Glu/Leu/Phe/Val family dehydrogenase [Pyrinomonadaceae bacterium]